MIRSLMSTTARAVTDRKGVTAAEYAVLAAGIILAVTAAVAGFGPGLTAKFGGVFG